MISAGQAEEMIVAGRPRFVLGFRRFEIKGRLRKKEASAHSLDVLRILKKIMEGRK